MLRHQLNVLRRRFPLNPKLVVCRSTTFRLALPPVSVGVERCHDYPAGDDRPVASDGVSTVLALEVALSRRSAEDTREIRRLIRR